MNQNEWFANGKKVELVAKTNDIQFDFTVTYSVGCTNHEWDEGKQLKELKRTLVRIVRQLKQKK